MNHSVGYLSTLLERRLKHLQSLRELSPAIESYPAEDQIFVLELYGQVLLLRDQCTRALRVILPAIVATYGVDSQIAREVVTSAKSALDLAYRLQRQLLRLAVIRKLDVDYRLLFRRNVQ